MEKILSSGHTYSALIALLFTAGSVAFNPGIPWFAWVAAFLFLFCVAEFTSSYIKADGSAAERKRSLIVLGFAGAAAVVFILALVALVR